MAIKTLKECATPKHQKDLASELKLLIYMGPHSNIVNVLASCTIRGDLWVIMEYCDHGDLKKFLSDRRKNFTPFWSKDSVDISTGVCLYDLLRMCKQVVNGIMFLHCWNVVHRDLSARNILVDANFNLKIADFGLARSNNFIASDDDVMPIKWTALESLLRHEYSTKSDIWSLGVLMWEIFSLGEIPYPGMSSKEVVRQLKEGYRMDPPIHCPDEIFTMITDCWDVDPDHRPTAEELFLQLDELNLTVVSAPDGQYYGQNVAYEEAGTIEGPSLNQMLDMKYGVEHEAPCSQTDICLETDGPNTASNSDQCQTKVEIDCLKAENDSLKYGIYELTVENDGQQREINKLREVIGYLQDNEKTIPVIIGQKHYDHMVRNSAESKEENAAENAKIADIFASNGQINWGLHVDEFDTSAKESSV